MWIATNRVAAVVLIVCCAAFTAIGTEQSSGNDQDDKADKRSGFGFRPPKRGAPDARRSGGARGDDRPMPSLTVLTPGQAGITAMPSPTLVWHHDRAAEGTVIMTVTDDTELITLVELRLYKKADKGIHRIDLAALGVKLKPEVLYTWSVGFTTSDKHTSSDPFAAGGIIFRPLDEAERSRIASLPDDERAAAYAALGSWYDALQIVVSHVTAAPEDATWHEYYVKLLSDVGLKALAD